MTGVVPVYHPRADARRAVRRGIPTGAGGGVRVCRSADQLRRLMLQRLIGAVVLDVKSVPADVFALPARYPRIPFYALSAFKPEDGPILARCRDSGFAGVLVEGVDNAVAGE
ncbi:MAG TPA: hypothetical protein VFU75_03235, partial [Gemmatimonadales bacterium]|nr:hypothetical protein [Gemmatimonadales bacterium]